MPAVTWIVRASLALWGLAVAAGLMPRLVLRARPDTLPGAMRAHGLDPSTVFLHFAIVLLFPFAVTLLARRVVPLLEQRRWAAWSFAALLASAPVTLMHYGTLRHVILHGVAAAGIVFVRRLEPRFTRADALLFPCLISFYFAFLDTGFGKTPAATFFRAAVVLLAVRLLVGAISKGRRPGVAFAAAPAAFVFQMQVLDPKVAGLLAAIWLIGTPLLLARFDERRVIRAAAWSALPLAAAAYPFALVGATSPAPLDFFEDGHSLLPASEMARREMPYRDIVPLHGLLTDGGFDLAAMKLIRDDLGAILMSRRVLAALTGTAIYFVALAVTTSAELALLATFLSLALYPAASIWPRAVLPLCALAYAVAAIRLRRPRLLLGAGVFTMLSTLASLDLALCSGVVAVLAAVRARALRPLAIGLAAPAVVMAIVFAACGFLTHFVTVTFTEVLGNGGVYVIGPIELPHGVRTLAEIAGALTHPETFIVLMWFLALIGASVALATQPWKARRGEAVWLIAGWIVLAGAAWVLRRHHYFAFALAPFLVGGLLAVRRQSRATAIALTVALVFFAKPFALIFDLTSLRERGTVNTKEWREFTALPRARGAVVDPLTYTGLAAAQRFVSSSLRTGETFVDFANAATLYYLFDRDCPLRQLEVPMYESEAAQREVIARIERNPRVRAALMTFPTAYSTIDGVSNRDRAPLVAAYFEKNFEPAFAEDGVEFWVRRKR